MNRRRRTVEQVLERQRCFPFHAERFEHYPFLVHRMHEVRIRGQRQVQVTNRSLQIAAGTMRKRKIELNRRLVGHTRNRLGEESHRTLWIAACQRRIPKLVERTRIIRRLHGTAILKQERESFPAPTGQSSHQNRAVADTKNERPSTS